MTCPPLAPSIWCGVCPTLLCHPSVDALKDVHCYLTLEHAGLEFSAFPRSGGLVSPAEFASMIGGIPYRAVRSLLVVVSTPSLQFFASILQRQEPVSVQVFAAQLAVERLDERIVCGLTRAGEVHDHIALVSPQIHVARNELGPITHWEAGFGMVRLP